MILKTKAHEIAYLFNRQFLLLWQGHAISQLGTYVFQIAMILWIKEHSNAASLLGFLLMVSHIPEVLLGPTGGTIADMFSKRKILIITDALSGLAVIILGLIVFLNSSDSYLILIALFVVSTILGIGSSFFNPAVSSLIPELVPKEKLQSGNAFYQFSTRGAMFIGQGIGGWFFAIMGAPILFLINGLSFLISAFSESFIQVANEQVLTKPTLRSLLRSLKTNLIEGHKYVWRNQGLKNFLLILGVYHFFISPLSLLIPFYVIDTLHISKAWIGILLSVFGLGTLSGFIISGIIKFQGKKRSSFLFGIMVLSAILFIATGLSQNLWICFFSLLLLGMIIGIIVVNLNTIMQQTADISIRGRLFGFLNTIMSASIPIGLGFFGIVIDIVKIIINTELAAPIIFLANGIGILLMILYLFRNHEFRKLLCIQLDN